MPVIKGNGYGYGSAGWLPGREAGLGHARCRAAGRGAQVRDAFAGDVVIFTHDKRATRRPGPRRRRRVITTVSRLADLACADAELGRPRVLVEVLTSMQRHGIRPDDLDGWPPCWAVVRFEGWTIHLPLLAEGRYAEARAARSGRSGGGAGPPLVLPPSSGGDQRTGSPTRWRRERPRAGAIADGDAVVVGRQIHPRDHGDGVGRAPDPAGRARWLSTALVSGRRLDRGDRRWHVTRHRDGGADLGDAPCGSGRSPWRPVRLEAAGLALSPYTINGRKRWFLEPPHMQSSLIFLPRKEKPPAIGDEVPVELRLTTATVDEIVTG